MSGQTAPYQDPSSPAGRLGEGAAGPNPEGTRCVGSVRGPDSGGTRFVGSVRGPGHDEARPSKRRLAVAVRIALGGLLIGSAVLFGCSEQTRYRVLSFFFDGVPPPGSEGEEPIRGEWGQLLTPGSPEYEQIKAERQARRDALAGTSVAANFVHAPYRDRNCTGCHSPELVGLPIESDAALCAPCHADHTTARTEQWVHGPTALGKCGLCHLPHESANAHLLTEPMPRLCLDCHDDPKLLERPHHLAAAAGQMPCTRCHDPHKSANRLLMVDSGTYARRRPDPALASTHAPYLERNCRACHTTEQAQAVVPNINDVCASCHEPVLAPRPGAGPAGKLHAAVAEKQCVTCHEPHQSSRPSLVRATAEKICLSCHTLDEVRAENHPAVERADCLLCHHGHHSEREFLLRAGVPRAADWGPRARNEPSGSGAGDRP